MFATQAEYRLTLPVKGFLGRFGVVAFAGVGGVAHKLTRFRFQRSVAGRRWRPAFPIDKKNPDQFPD